ncbi:MAG: hypothetical protein FJY28_01690 [Betaproteobacteria bacterium]|nr:hypothetical protein [Betaproteobacteria bacterium]
MAVNQHVCSIASAQRHRNQTQRAIVIGPIIRLALDPVEPGMFGKDAVIEAQLSAAQYRQQDFREGGTLVLTPRKARVFMEG